MPAIRDAHLLLAKYNAWQPGVFALSGWDLTGMLTVPAEEVRDLIATGDTRWIERGAHDLTRRRPRARRDRSSGMPRGRSLYGSLPAQLGSTRLVRLAAWPTSSPCGASTASPSATQVDIPEVAHAGMLVLVHRLDDGRRTRGCADPADRAELLRRGRSTAPCTRRSSPPQHDVVDADDGRDHRARRRPAELRGAPRALRRPVPAAARTRRRGRRVTRPVQEPHSPQPPGRRASAASRNARVLDRLSGAALRRPCRSATGSARSARGRRGGRPCRRSRRAAPASSGTRSRCRAGSARGARRRRPRARRRAAAEGDATRCRCSASTICCSVASAPIRPRSRRIASIASRSATASARACSTGSVSRPSRARRSTCSPARYPAVGGRSWVFTVASTARR